MMSRITAHPRGAFISVGDWTAVTHHLKEVGVFSTEINNFGSERGSLTARNEICFVI